MSERRYRDEDVRRILELATRSDAAAPVQRGPEEGLTLPEIQSIALEVGVPADAVARAAAQLDASAGPRPRTSLGMPIEVSHTTQLPRDLTAAEWTQLVAELRATFRARGNVEVQSGVREWFNGNLHAAVEPTAHGYRLRLGTLKGSASGVNALGVTGVAAGVVVFAASALGGGALDPAGPLLLALAGGGAFLSNLVRLPRWANLRQRQMQAISEKALQMVGAAVTGPIQDVEHSRVKPTDHR